jgi:hypothetical protein
MDNSPKAPVALKVERKELPKLAQIALREISKNTDNAVNEVVGEAGKVLGINPSEGWQFDANTLSFVRPEPNSEVAK